MLMTVGHSRHDWLIFKSLLDRHDIGLLVDVRSFPRSRLAYFNKAELRARLNHAGVAYLHAGAELGGYSDHGDADYAAMTKSSHFLRGVDQVLNLASRTRLALMCAEAEPLECHRCLLITRHLAGQGETVGHILRDGGIEPHEATEDRLLEALDQTEADLLASRETQLAQAYEKQELRIRRGLKLPQSRKVAR